MTAHPGSARPTRLMGVVLVAIWAALAVAVAWTYRPGGPADVLVAAAFLLPVLLAAVALVWPALPAGGRDGARLAWLWLLGVLLGISLLSIVAGTLARGGPQTLLPSLEVGYAGFLALLALATFSLLGFAHRRGPGRVFEREATRRALVLALLVTLGLSAVLGGVLVVNDRAVRASLPAASGFGPTDPDAVPPECEAGAALGPNARVAMRAHGSVDDEPVSEALIEGRRSGWDEAWSAHWRRLPREGGAGSAADERAPATGSEGSGGMAYRRIGERAWLNRTSADLDAPGRTWTAVEPDPFDLRGGHDLTMDGPPADLLGPARAPILTEALGLEVLDGARARHCRIYVDGATAFETFLPLRWLTDAGPRGAADPLLAWRGELDWWVFADGQLGRTEVRVSGLSSEAWSGVPGIRGSLEVTLEALERDRTADLGGPPA